MNLFYFANIEPARSDAASRHVLELCNGLLACHSSQSFEIEALEHQKLDLPRTTSMLNSFCFKDCITKDFRNCRVYGVAGAHSSVHPIGYCITRSSKDGCG